MFDSAVEWGQPAEFLVSGVIVGWIKALTLVPVGLWWELYIPHKLVYDERGVDASILSFNALIFKWSYWKLYKPAERAPTRFLSPTPAVLLTAWRYAISPAWGIEELSCRTKNIIITLRLIFEMYYD